MMKQLLFLQGAGEGAYDEDKNLAESLQKALASDYKVNYPEMVDEENAPYAQWTQQIEKEVDSMQEPIFLIGHSVGASVMIKWLSENEVKKPIAGIFLIATPFWGGDGWLYEGYEELELSKELAANFSKATPLFFYHCRDDEIVPFEHLALYAKLFPQATVRELEAGGHQLNNDLSAVAKDIKALKS